MVKVLRPAHSKVDFCGACGLSLRPEEKGCPDCGARVEREVR